MAKYFYVARDYRGDKNSGLEDAPSQDELVGRLQARGLTVVSVTLEAEKQQAGPLTAAEAALRNDAKKRHYRVKSSDLTLFCRQLSTLLGAGITILKSLQIISKQVSSQKLYNVIQTLQKNMEQGLSLHEAMAKHPKIFSDLWVNLVESGEASGNLAIVLNRLATFLERSAAFRAKIISALIYPILLVFAATGVLLFMTIKVIPTFAQIFSGLNVTLPVLTRIVFAFSFFLRKYILLFVLAIGAVIFFITRYIKTKEGRLRFENFKFGLPLFGEFFRAIVVERFSSELSTLIESGVPILYSLEIAERSIGNAVMAGVIRQVKESVREGKGLASPLEKSGFFEPMVIQMVMVGEEIGELPQMLKRINTFYQEYVETFLARILALFEPMMLVCMGFVVGIIVIGMFLPIFSIAKIH